MSDTATQPSEIQPVALAHMDALPPGTMLGEFELQALLGVGGFGMVYRGYDHSLHRPVAIKEYMPSALVGRETGGAVTARSTVDALPFQTGLQSFIAEARVLARFDHPSLVKVYRFWEANNTAYMAMPLYEGITLKEARRRMSGPPPEDWLRSVLWSVLEALRVLHDNNTLHRDVSPDNIFLQNVGPPVLLDLGAARRAIMDSSHKHTAVLKVNYAPIEQYADAHDLREGPWTDLYALAAVVHGCLCNEPPLPATFRVLRDRMPAFSQVAQTAQTHFGQSYSPEFVAAVAHALAIEPDARTVSVDAFAQEMQLQPPADIARFDWRAALGPSIVLDDATPAVADPTTALLTTQPAPPAKTMAQTTRVRERTVNTGRSKKSRRSSRDPSKSRESRVPVAVPAKAGALPWVLGGLAALLLSVGTYWVLKPSKPTTPDAVVGAQMTTEQSVSAPVAASVLAPVVEVAPPVSEPATRSMAAPAKMAAASAPTAAAPATPRVPKIEPRATAPVPAPVAVPAPSPTLCADATVLTRTMCIYRECQKPEHVQLPVCIADRKHWEEQNRSKNGF